MTAWPVSFKVTCGNAIALGMPTRGHPTYVPRWLSLCLGVRSMFYKASTEG